MRKKGKVRKTLEDIPVILSKLVKILLEMKIFITLSSNFGLLELGMKQKGGPGNVRKNINKNFVICSSLHIYHEEDSLLVHTRSWLFNLTLCDGYVWVWIFLEKQINFLVSVLMLISNEE